MSSAPIPAQPAQPKSWFARHLALTVVLAVGVLFLLGLVFVAGIVVFVMSAMKQSDVYIMAVEQARQSPAVMEVLGEPVTPAWYLTGNINVSGSSGEADIAIPISGPKGKGTLYAVGRKSAGEWTMQRLEVEVAGRGGRIDLLGGKGEPPGQEQ